MKEKEKGAARPGNAPLVIEEKDNLFGFDFQGFKVRFLEIDGQPWWVGKDVALALGYKDTVNALKQHCGTGCPKYHPIVDSLGREQLARIINEPNLFHLILHSRLPEAEKFERKVFEEILPQIRRTGFYIDPLAAGRFLPVRDGELGLFFLHFKDSHLPMSRVKKIHRYFRMGLSGGEIARLMRVCRSQGKVYAQRGRLARHEAGAIGIDYAGMGVY